MHKKSNSLDKKFQKFFKRSGLSHNKLAELCHISPNYIRNIIKGYARPSKRLKLDLVEKTNGFIQMEDFRIRVN